MSEFSVEFVFTFLMTLFGIVCLVLGLLGIILAPWLIDRVDSYLDSLNPEGEMLFKGYPVSLGRLVFYGLVIMFSHSRLMQRKVFVNRSDRVRAVADSPRWVLFVTQWIYGMFFICGVFAFSFGGLMMLADKL